MLECIRLTITNFLSKVYYMDTFINLLIGLLIGLILCSNFRIREGQGPMVGSIMFPSSYKGITDVLHKKIKVKEKTNTDVFTQADTDVIVKQDERIDVDKKSQQWYDKKKDIEEKKNVDVVRRYPEVWNTASIEDCNKKQDQLFNNYVEIEQMQKETKYLQEWMNKLPPTIIRNEDQSRENTNAILRTARIISDSLRNVESGLDKNIPVLVPT
jgi:hypothetical protein